MYRKAATYALSAGIRTASQTAAGLLAAISIVDAGEIRTLASALAVVGVGSILSGLAAFLMNFAELLNVEE